jgi:hypothetical protein
MQLHEEIKKIQKLILELSITSDVVLEFIEFVENYPEIIPHLKFSSMTDLKEYIMDASISEFDELRKEAEHFVKRREKYFKDEIDEFERASQDLSRDENIDVSVSQLMDLFQQAREITIPEKVWNKLENTECNQIKKGEMKKVLDLAKKYNKQNPKELKKALLSGDYRRPLILKFGDRFHLVAGNTRLCTAAALGMRPKVLIAEI